MAYSKYQEKNAGAPFRYSPQYYAWRDAKLPEDKRHFANLHVKFIQRLTGLAAPKPGTRLNTEGN